MLRIDTLSELEAAMREGRPVVPTAELRRAIEAQARIARARLIGDAFKAAFKAITGQGPWVIPAGRVDVVRGH